MYKEVLNNKQLELLPMMAQFKREYYLVGGTAIALFLGHRRSIDFDMFKPTPINHKRNLEKFESSGYNCLVTRRVVEQMNLVVNDVKITFYQYPFPVNPNMRFENIFRIPSLLQLAAMKAYALGRRSKWKDYVDLYFLLRDCFSISEIAKCASSLYGDLFSEKLFRSQLCYFDDVDYGEVVDYLVEEIPSDELIRQQLTDYALTGF